MECQKHSGVCSDIEHLQKSDHAQWRDIKQLEKRQWHILWGTLGAVGTGFVNLVVGVVVAVIVWKIKNGG